MSRYAELLVAQVPTSHLDRTGWQAVRAAIGLGVLDLGLRALPFGRSGWVTLSADVHCPQIPAYYPGRLANELWRCLWFEGAIDHSAHHNLGRIRFIIEPANALKIRIEEG